MFFSFHVIKLQK